MACGVSRNAAISGRIPALNATRLTPGRCKNGIAIAGPGINLGLVPLNRRRFLTRSGLLAATAASLPTISRAQDPLNPGTGQKPSHIIHMVADGMSLGTLSAANQLSHLTRKRALTWMELYNQPGVGNALVDMR